MYLVLLSLLGLCCGQSIQIIDSDTNFALLEKGILENVRQPIIQLVNSVKNDMWSKANQRAIRELQHYVQTQDWQKILNRSITTFLQNHAEGKFDEHQQSVASLNGTLMECCETNSKLQSRIRALENELNESKLENKDLNLQIRNLSIKLKEITQSMEDKLLDERNATNELQNQIEEIKLENSNVLNTLFENITYMKEKLGIKDDGRVNTDVTGIDCHDIYQKGARQDGIYKIKPADWPSSPFEVYCDMSDGGWTLLQRRIDGSENFTRSWNDYRNGFGSLNHEFWLGLEKIHHLTKTSRKVKFDFQLRNGNLLNLEYGIFQVKGSATQYTLRVEQHISGLKANSFIYNNRRKFVTYDRDNGCARRRYGGWWYGNCTYLNINGKYSLLNNEAGMTEHCCGSVYNNFKKTIMKIK